MPSYHFQPQDHLPQLQSLFAELTQQQTLSDEVVSQIIQRHPSAVGTFFTKHQLIKAYQHLVTVQTLPANSAVESALQMKPIRTSSGVTPVTVLTKPFPCPGTCIFCPNDIRMPKSYLSDEPGAQRAERNYFDPYLQTYNRLAALQNIGHSIDKVELIILGGTWSYYPEPYQIWFIKECLRALNEFGVSDGREAVEARYEQMNKVFNEKKQHAPSNDPQLNAHVLRHQAIQGENLNTTYNQKVSELYVAPERLAGFDAYQQATWDELEHEQKGNETSTSRNVGLVIETRPDNISEAEIIRIRRLGCTKTQIGFQSLQDEVLLKNKRGHDVAATRRAVRLLRQAGFKIHAHWMANLHGSSVELDKADYQTLFKDPDFMPDELKIYPCSLIGSAELMQYYQDGRWRPYTHAELLDVLSFCLTHTPEYCRLTRVIRDIPSTDIVEGNKLTNFRQIAEQHTQQAGQLLKDIRSREVRKQVIDPMTLQLNEVWYETTVSQEVFIQFVDDSPQKRIAGFVRLSLPKENSFIEELHESAIIRELHVYGQAVGLGQRSQTKVQHQGLGKKLLAAAEHIVQQRGFKRLAVISAIGTREYYRQRGFIDGQLYQFKPL